MCPTQARMLSTLSSRSAATVGRSTGALEGAAAAPTIVVGRSTVALEGAAHEAVTAAQSHARLRVYLCVFVASMGFDRYKKVESTQYRTGCTCAFRAPLPRRLLSRGNKRLGSGSRIQRWAVQVIRGLVKGEGGGCGECARVHWYTMSKQSG